MSPTPLIYSTSTPGVRKGALFLLLADAVQGYLGPGWATPEADCQPGNHISTNGTCEECTEKTGSNCNTCSKVCIISDCQWNFTGSTYLCPTGFTPTGNWMSEGQKKCVSHKWQYECCSYKENKDSCELDKGNPLTKIAEEARKYTEKVGSQCAAKSAFAAGVGKAGAFAFDIAKAFSGRRRRLRHCWRSMACRYNPLVGVQRNLDVLAYTDGDSISFMLHARNENPDSYVRSIGFSYKGPDGVLCQKKFLPHWYTSAYFADEEMQCGGDKIRAWGYNEVLASTSTSGGRITVNWNTYKKRYAQDMKLFIGPFKLSDLDKNIEAGYGFSFGANFYKWWRNGQLYVYKWQDYTAENQTCSSASNPE